MEIIIASYIIALIFGVLILAFPKFLRYFVGIYFLLIGTLGILNNLNII